LRQAVSHLQPGKQIPLEFKKGVRVSGKAWLLTASCFSVKSIFDAGKRLSVFLRMIARQTLLGHPADA